MAECSHVVFIYVEWEMRAEKQETQQVLSALLQKFSLKINIAAYELLEYPRASKSKTVSPTSEIRPSTESQQEFPHFYAYIVYVK